MKKTASVTDDRSMRRQSAGLGPREGQKASQLTSKALSTKALSTKQLIDEIGRISDKLDEREPW